VAVLPVLQNSKGPAQGALSPTVNEGAFATDAQRSFKGKFTAYGL